jgi:hypothetical protein
MGRNTKKKNNKIRDRRLAVSKPVEPPKPAMKAELADNDDYNGSHLKGKKSLIEKIKTQGVYIRVLSNTRKFRIENPNTSYKDLGDITPTERRYLLEFFRVEIKFNKYGTGILEFEF